MVVCGGLSAPLYAGCFSERVVISPPPPLTAQAALVSQLHAPRFSNTLLIGSVIEAVFGSALASSLEDLVVHEEHDEHGDVEGHGGGVDGVAEVLADQTHSLRVDVLRPAAERRQRDGGRDQPHPEDHLGHQLPILTGRVGQRPCDAEIPTKKTAAG